MTVNFKKENIGFIFPPELHSGIHTEFKKKFSKC